MKGIKQPVGFVKLTNVAVVRLKKKGVRYEVACYKNKVNDWREKIETDMSEVLQVDNVFTNVSKGLIANKQELENSFPGMKRNDIINLILTTGELQVAELERGTSSESIVKDIANIISEKTLNTTNFSRFSVSIVMKAMDAVHYVVKPGESAKKQALAVIKMLQGILPLRRIKMRIALNFPAKNKELIKTKLLAVKDNVELLSESPEVESKMKIVLLIEPNLYREMLDLMKEAEGTLDIEDQYGELAKGKESEDEGSSLQYMKLLENLEKMSMGSEKGKDEKEEKKQKKPVKKEEKTKTIVCSTCKEAVFENPKEYRTHVKSGWHLDSLKRKMDGLAPFSLKEFEEKLFEETLKEGKK